MASTEGCLALWMSPSLSKGRSCDLSTLRFPLLCRIRIPLDLEVCWECLLCCIAKGPIRTKLWSGVVRTEGESRSSFLPGGLTWRSRELRPIRRRCYLTKTTLVVPWADRHRLVDDLEGLSHALEYVDEPRWGYCVEIKTSSIDYYDKTQTVMSGAARSVCVDDHLMAKCHVRVSK